MGFTRQEYWSGLPFPLPGDLPDPRIKPASLVSCIGKSGLFTTSATHQFSSVPSLHGKLMGKQWKQWDFIFLGSKITADDDCSHDIKKHLLLGRKSMTSFSSVQFSSVPQSCPTLCDPMNRSTPGLPVHDQLPEFTQTHVHGVSDAIQPSHPLLSPSPPAPNPSQHQSLFLSQLFA